MRWLSFDWGRLLDRLKALLIGGILLFRLTVSLFAQGGGPYDLSWWTIDGGGGSSTGENFTLNGTFGQPQTGSVSGGSYTLTSGFWGTGVGDGPASGIIAPSDGGEVTLDDGTVNLTFPGGAVVMTTTVTIAAKATPSQPTDNLIFANRGFDVVATDANGVQVSAFNQPFELALTYDDADWRQAGIVNESRLNVYFWNGSAWEALLPCDDCSHDREHNQFTIMLDHLTEFALLAADDGVGEKIYLPIVIR